MIVLIVLLLLWTVLLPNLAEEESAEKATSLMTVSYCFSNSSIRSFKAYRTKKRDDKIRQS